MATRSRQPKRHVRQLRAARIVARAAEVFGDADKARAWLRRRTHALGGRAPRDLLASTAGARAVEELLGRIEHGIAA